MEELKLLIEAVAGLPTITLWVLVGYLIYKLAVIGSVYGLLRFTVEHLYKWLAKSERNALLTMRGQVISNAEGPFGRLEVELLACRGIVSGSTTYFHPADIDWVIAAITEKRERDDAKSKKP